MVRFRPDRSLSVVLVVAACAAASACAGSPRGPEIGPRSGLELTSADISTLAALLEAADARRPDTVVVDRALRSPTPFVRAYAARTVGQIPIPNRAGTLRSLVSDPDSMIAADAAFALGLMRDTAAIPVLAGALAGPPTVATAAAWSLGDLGAAGRSAIESALRSGQPASSLEAVLVASAKLRPVPASLIIPYLDNPDLAVQRSAAYALTRSRVPAATRPLLTGANRLGSPTWVAGNAVAHNIASDLRSYVARGLAQPAAGDSLASEALIALRRLAEDSHPHVRINALRSLASFGNVARSDVVRHLRDSDSNVRIALAQALGDVFDSDRTNWMAAWVADTGFTYRRSLISAALRDGVRLPALAPNSGETWSRHADWRYRAAVAQAVSAGTAADIDAIALPLLRDPDARVRSAAYGSASNWSDSASAASKAYARSALPNALSDPDLFVRASILDALRSRARAPDAVVAFNAWRRAASDPENDARVAALRVIGAAWRSDSVSFVSWLRDSLAASRPPVDPVERSVGRSAGPFNHWPAAASPEKPAAWYEDQARTFIARERVGRATSATITTERGDIRVQFFGADAPLTVSNFVQLARRRYFDGSAFHRVVPNFVAQDGDPRGDGSGGPGYAIRDELNRRWYERGAVGMALSGPDTGGSQYFLTHSPQPHLDGHYTVFGLVVDGLDVLDSLVQGDRILQIRIQ